MSHHKTSTIPPAQTAWWADRAVRDAVIALRDWLSRRPRHQRPVREGGRVLQTAEAYRQIVAILTERDRKARELRKSATS